MIAVTGAAGFIGSMLVSALNARGLHDILIVDPLGREGKFKNLRAKTFMQIMAPEEFARQLAQGACQPSAILHIGAITDTSEPDADLVLAHNTDYTRTLATLAQQRGIRFIYASSASVYGDGRQGFSDSDDLTPRLLPLNPYAFSKWLTDTEALRQRWAERIVGLRFFNVFGPNEYHKGFCASVVLHAYRQIEQTGKMALFQSHREDIAHGEQRRDFVYVKDVADVVLWFLEHPDVNGIYNLGSGKARSFNDLANAIFAAVERPAKIDFVPTPESIRASYQYFTEADLAKLRAAGCSHKFMPLEEAVKDYVQNYLQRDNPYA